MNSIAELLRAPGRPPVRTLEPLGEGDFCRAYLLNGRRVVRVAKHPVGARALAREACVLPRIERFLPATVPVPEFVAGPDPGRSFAIHDHVVGEPLTAGRWRAMGPGSRLAVARELGSFLAALHAVDPALVVPCGLPRVTARERAVERAAGLRDGALGVPDPDGELARALDRCLAEDLLAGPEAVLHCDVSPEHVRVGPSGRLSGVIDWGDVALGDPARDLIFLYEDWGDDFLRGAIEGYGGADPGRLRTRALAHYLVDQLEWTMGEARAGRRGAVESGVAALGRAVLDFGRSG